MSQSQDNLIVVLDVGSAQTRILAADLNEGALRYRGHAALDSAGMRKGMIADLGPAARVVKSATEQCERAARANIDECVVGVGGPEAQPSGPAVDSGAPEQPWACRVILPD